VQTDVYFDDVKMTYTPTNILQSNEYYPFGLQTANSWTRDNTTNNFLYNSSSELNTTTGMYDLPFRNYDAALGRFFQVDPLAHTSSDLTPYHYANNNPVAFNDPSGAVVPYYAKPEDDPRNWRMTIHNDNPYFDFGGEPIGGGSWSDDHSGVPPPPDPYGDAKKVASGEMTRDEYLAKYSEELTQDDPGKPWFKDISDPKNYPGIKIYQTSAVVSGTAVTIPGLGIFISNDYDPGLEMTQTLQHEYGHFLDYTFSPDLNGAGQFMPTIPWVNYMTIIGIPSAFDLMTGSTYDEHHDFYTEQRADAWAAIWFGSNYKGK